MFEHWCLTVQYATTPMVDGKHKEPAGGVFILEEVGLHVHVRVGGAPRQRVSYYVKYLSVVRIFTFRPKSDY